MPSLTCPHSTSLTSGLCGAAVVPQSGKEVQKKSKHPIQAARKSLYPPPLPHHQMLKSLEDKREPGILMPPPTICLLLKSQFSNFQPTTILQIPRSASVTFKALRDLAPIYFSCRDPALVMVIPALQHTPLCAGPLTPLTHSHTSAHLLAGNDSSRLR